MPDRIHIEGFDETQPDPADPWESPPHQAERLARTANENRRQNDVIVDRKLVSLKNHVVDLHREMSDLKTSQAKNNEMTEKILTIISSGKLIANIIKFFGVMAVPVTAIYTMWYVWKHGVPPPTP